MQLNQFFITNKVEISSVGVGFNKTVFKEFSIFNHQKLSLSIANHQTNSVAILGFIIDPFSFEKSNQDIANDLVLHPNKETLFKALEKYSGRYVIISSINNNTIIITDFIAQRHVYYFFEDSNIFLSSCDALLLNVLKLEPEINPDVKTLINTPTFLKVQQHWLLGETEWDRRLKQILPNHYLNTNTKVTQRMPLFISKALNKKQVLDLSKTILKNSLKAVTNRYKCYLALTAGLDSRLAMAASLDFKNKINYFTFKRQDPYVLKDAEIAQKLATRYSLNYKSIIPEKLQDAFIKKYKNQFIVSRLLLRTQNIQWFKNQTLTQAINISGTGGEIQRCYYDNKLFNTAQSICKAIDMPAHSYHLNAINKWLPDAKVYCEKYNINLSDLFFYEIRLGKWSSKVALEMDFTGVEEFSPFNNKLLAFSILFNIPETERLGNAFLFRKALTQSFLPDAFNIPTNPKIVKDYIKQIIGYKYYKRAIQKLRYKQE